MRKRADKFGTEFVCPFLRPYQVHFSFTLIKIGRQATCEACHGLCRAPSAWSVHTVTSRTDARGGRETRNNSADYRYQRDFSLAHCPRNLTGLIQQESGNSVSTSRTNLKHPSQNAARLQKAKNYSVVEHDRTNYVQRAREANGHADCNPFLTTTWVSSPPPMPPRTPPSFDGIAPP